MHVEPDGNQAHIRNNSAARNALEQGTLIRSSLSFELA